MKIKKITLPVFIPSTLLLLGVLSKYMNKIILMLFMLFLLSPFSALATGLTTQQSTSLINVVQAAPGVPANAFVQLITAFSNITVNQAESLINVVQAAPGVPANAFVSLLMSFTIDTNSSPTTPAVTPITQSQNTVEIQISNVNVTVGISSARIEWSTNIPTESKIFLSGGELSSKVYNSDSGLSTRHSITTSGLKANTTYSYEIETISGGIDVVKKQGSFETLSIFFTPTSLELSPQNLHLGLYCSETKITVQVIDQRDEEMVGQPVEVTSTYTGVTQTGTSPFTADFGFNAMKEATFSLKIKSGILETERIINVSEPNFRLISTDGRFVNPNYDSGPFEPDQNDGTYTGKASGYSLIKTETGFVCKH